MDVEKTGRALILIEENLKKAFDVALSDLATILAKLEPLTSRSEDGTITCGGMIPTHSGRDTGTVPASSSA